MLQGFKRMIMEDLTHFRAEQLLSLHFEGKSLKDKRPVCILPEDLSANQLSAEELSHALEQAGVQILPIVTPNEIVGRSIEGDPFELGNQPMISYALSHPERNSVEVISVLDAALSGRLFGRFLETLSPNKKEKYNEEGVFADWQIASNKYGVDEKKHIKALIEKHQTMGKPWDVFTRFVDRFIGTQGGMGIHASLPLLRYEVGGPDEGFKYEALDVSVPPYDLLYVDMARKCRTIPNGNTVVPETFNPLLGQMAAALFSPDARKNWQSDHHQFQTLNHPHVRTVYDNLSKQRVPFRQPQGPAQIPAKSVQEEINFFYGSFRTLHFHELIARAGLSI